MRDKILPLVDVFENVANYLMYLVKNVTMCLKMQFENQITCIMCGRGFFYKKYQKLY